MNHLHHQRGVALVFVVFVVALVAVLATNLLSGQFVQIRKLENSLNHVAMLQHAYGVESWGVEVLKRDRLESQSDHLAENWATPLQPVQIDASSIRVAGLIEDENARFDVNSLIKNGQADHDSAARLKALARLQGQDAAIIDSLLDWMDPDSETQSAGAESPYYQGLEPAYFVPNRPLAHISEAAYVKDMNTLSLRWLQDNATTLPEPATVNINTAPAPVLSLVLPALPEAVIENLLRHRESTPFATMDEVVAYLKQQAGYSDEQLANVDLQAVSVSSRFFLVTSSVQMADNTLQLKSRVYRDPKGGLRVYERNISWLQ